MITDLGSNNHNQTSRERYLDRLMKATFSNAVLLQIENELTTVLAEVSALICSPHRSDQPSGGTHHPCAI